MVLECNFLNKETAQNNPWRFTYKTSGSIIALVLGLGLP